MFAVCVTFEIYPEMRGDFLPFIQAQAENSLSLEPGCLRFDVWSDDSRPNTIYLYEIYETEEAFQDHIERDHFQTFNTATQMMVIEKSISTWNKPVLVT